MTTDIQLLRSSAPRKRPDPLLLLDGQAAINTNVEEPGLYFKLSNNALTKIGPAAYTTGGNAPNSSPAGSVGNAIGETWLDGRSTYENAIFKVFNGSTWVNSSGFNVDDATGNFSLAKLLTVSTLVADGTGDASYIRFPNDTTAGRPSTPQMGMFRFNTDDNVFEGYDGTAWVNFIKNSGGGGGGDITLNEITITGNANLGSNCGASVVTINGRTLVNCDITLGATSGSNVTFTARVNSDIVPADLNRALGSQTLPWLHTYTEDLTASGDVTIGTACANDSLDIAAVLTQTCQSNFLNAVTVYNNNELRFSPSGSVDPSANWVGFKAPPTLNARQIWGLPTEDGSPGQVLRTDGAGQLSWVTALTGGGSGGDLVISGDLTVTGSTTLSGDTIIGDNCNDNLTIRSATSLECNFTPFQDNTINLGSPALRFANVYTNDLHLANDRGDWTMIEEEQYLSLRDNKTGKVFRIIMEEV